MIIEDQKRINSFLSNFPDCQVRHIEYINKIPKSLIKNYDITKNQWQEDSNYLLITAGGNKDALHIVFAAYRNKVFHLFNPGTGEMIQENKLATLFENQDLMHYTGIAIHLQSINLSKSRRHSLFQNDSASSNENINENSNNKGCSIQ